MYDDFVREITNLRCEKEQLNSLVNSCQEEIRQLKKQLEEYKDNYNCLLKQKEQFEYIMSKQVDYQGQQKEFIEWLEEQIKKEKDDLEKLCELYKIPKENNSAYSFAYSYINKMEAILEKYKQITGVLDEKK